MLILSRRFGESLHIGQEISLTILGIKGNQVKIGIDAPKAIAVHREEIYEKIKMEHKTVTDRNRKKLCLKNKTR